MNLKHGLITIALTSILAGCGGGSDSPASTSPASTDPGTVDPGTVEPGSVEPGDINPSASLLRFSLKSAVSVVATNNTAVQDASDFSQAGVARSANSKLNSFTFIDADNAIDFEKQKRVALGIVGGNAKAISEEGSSSNFFVIDESGQMSFAAESEFDFSVSYSVVKDLINDDGETEQFIYFAISDQDFWLSQEFVISTGNCAIFRVATADDEWSCVAPDIVAISMNDSYRQTMSDDKRKPLQVDEQGNVFVLANNIYSEDGDGDGVVDWIDLDWSVQPTIRKISPDGDVKEITRDDIWIQSYIKIDDDSLVYSYSGDNTGLKMIVGLSEETQSSVELGNQGYWNDFFYAIDDHNTIIFSQNGGESNSGISFGQKSETFVGGAETFNLNTQSFSSDSWNSTPRRVILSDDGSIYGLFEESSYHESTGTWESMANLKRILPYSSATFARFSVGNDWWGYFDNGQRNIQLSKGYAFYLEDEEHGAYGTRTNIKAVRMVDGELTTMLDGEWATERYEISTWKLSGDTIYFSGFDSANSQMIAGQVDTLKMKQGLGSEEYLTIDSSASIVGENNVIDDYEVLRASAPDNYSGGSPRIVQVFSNPENVYSASIEFNKWMNRSSVGSLTSVTYQNELDETVDVKSMKVWLGRRLHLIFDGSYDPAVEVLTDPLPFGTEFDITVDSSALDLEGLQLIMSDSPVSSSFVTRPEAGFYSSSAEVIEGISDGTVLRYSATEDQYGQQAKANLATDIKVINHRVEFSTPAKIEGRLVLRLLDPYQVNWNNNVLNKIIDTATATEWQNFEWSEVDAQKNIYLHFTDENALFDEKWQRVLSSMTITPTTVANVDGEVFLDSENAKTYIEIPDHLEDINGVMFSEDYDNLRSTSVRKNLETSTEYYYQEGYITDSDTATDYHYSFGEWRDSEGNTLPATANTVYVDSHWLDETTGAILEDNFQWVGQTWMNVDDNTEIISKPSTDYINDYYGSDLNGDLAIDLSGLSFFGGRAEATEVTREWLDTWEWQSSFVAQSFESSSDDYRWFSYAEFGGWGQDNSGNNFGHTALNQDEVNYFYHDWDSRIDTYLESTSSWLKHTYEYTTDELDATKVNFSYVATDSDGNEVYSTSKVLFVDVVEASWSYLLDTDSQGGFGLELSIENNGSISIDNLKVTDLTGLDNVETEGVIFESDFSDGNEGVFVEVE